MATKPDPLWRRIEDRARGVLLRFAQLLWLPILEWAGERLYQWALARSHRP